MADEPMLRGQPERETVPFDAEWERDQDALMQMFKADPANWRTHPATPDLPPYYVGPQMQGDGTIDYSGHDGWPDGPPASTREASDG